MVEEKVLPGGCEREKGDVDDLIFPDQALPIPSSR